MKRWATLGLTSLSIACGGGPGCNNCYDIELPECVQVDVIEWCQGQAPGACILTNVSVDSPEFVRFDGAPASTQVFVVDLVALQSSFADHAQVDVAGATLQLHFSSQGQLNFYTIAILFDGSDAACEMNTLSNRLFCEVPSGATELEVRREPSAEQLSTFELRVELVPPCRLVQGEACGV